jgi:hypothetical protein
MSVHCVHTIILCTNTYQGSYDELDMRLAWGKQESTKNIMDMSNFSRRPRRVEVNGKRNCSSIDSGRKIHDVHMSMIKIDQLF